MYFAVVLSDVEIDGPRAEGVGHLLVGRPEFLFAIAFLHERVFGGVVAEGVEVGVGEVGLEAERFGHADAFEDIEHILPAVHTGPAYFAFGGETFAVIGGDLGGFFEGGNDGAGVGCGIFAPFLHAKLRGINADHAALAGTVFVEHLGNAAGHLDGFQKFAALFFCAHG